MIWCVLYTLFKNANYILYTDGIVIMLTIAVYYSGLHNHLRHVTVDTYADPKWGPTDNKPHLAVQYANGPGYYKHRQNRLNETVPRLNLTGVDTGIAIVILIMYYIDNVFIYLILFYYFKWHDCITYFLICISIYIYTFERSFMIYLSV